MFKIFEYKKGSLGHYYGLYLTAEDQILLEITRFVLFRQSRFGFKEILSKNIDFEESYSIF